jgi:hypothetical protein
VRATSGVCATWLHLCGLRCVPHGYYQSVAELIPRQHQLLKLTLIVTNYCSDVVQQNLRPTPDWSKLLTPSDIKGLACMPVTMTLVENALRKARTHYEPKLVALCGASQARILMRSLETMIVRLTMGKAAHRPRVRKCPFFVARPCRAQQRQPWVRMCVFGVASLSRRAVAAMCPEFVFVAG